MGVQRDERSLLTYGLFQNQGIVGASQPAIGCASDILTGVSQQRDQISTKHLIRVEAHGGLRRVEDSDFRMENAVAGVFQSSLNIGSC